MKPWRAALLVLAASVTPATAQSGFDAANGKVGILEAAGSIGLDLSETKISLFWVGGTEQAKKWRQWDASIATAAKKSTRGILASGDWNPEFAASARHSWFRENEGAGYLAAFVAGQGAVAGADLFTTVNDTIIATMSSTTQATLLGAAGLNVGITEDHILGVTIRAGYQFNGTASAKTEEVCTRKAAGFVDGNVAEAIECKQRLKGQAFDRWVGHARVDGTFKIVTPDAADLPTIGLLVATSLTSADNSKPLFAVAGGPTLHPPSAPSTFAAAILAEITDIGNVTAQPFKDRFFIRLYAAIPFSIF
jgi:hypothetical protein